ncbi:MAG TPA: hypothetical protein PK668_10670 [Myxococcota bacterium]|nr:hypothetical protein [Myxococcota bacterium]HRY93374.1 hypothetical protein [Myxococcota bacterium]HSA22248.1 hypothetical protein [Myxococcota bacterium]
MRTSVVAWLGASAVGLLGLGCEQDEARELVPTIARAPADPLAGSELASCAVYLEERCQAGRLERCALYAPQAGEFVAQPDPLLRRVLLYDRWYDLYMSPNGLTAERTFNRAMPGDAPEEEWGALDSFGGYAGEGDAAIWTGTALVADAFRYAATGTEADYQRMEDKTRAMLRDFEVTGVPGYLARFHFLVVPPGTPLADRIMMRAVDVAAMGGRDLPVEAPEAIAGLPAEYATGVPDGAGGTVPGEVWWHGHPSIDQYTGPMTAFPLVYNLLRDEELKAAIVQHMTCYLKRLRRLEVRNLHDNPEVLAELTGFFAGADANFDADDIDLTQLDTLVAYYLPDLNRESAAGFDRTCPEDLAWTATRVLDASSQTFMTDMLDLAGDISTTGDTPMPNGIAHFYIVNVRGGDASHMIHLAAMAYYFTGDERYRRFLHEELIGRLRAPEVALTMMAFRLPDWCFRYYGDHITYNTHWQLLTLLGDSPLRDTMLRVMEEEAWQKALSNHKSAKFNAMYASTVPAGLATGRDQALAELMAQLQDFGGNGGSLDAPRRTYSRDRQAIIDALPAGNTLRCPSEDERRRCEEAGDIFGVPLESEDISYACDGRPGECQLETGECADALASEGLPPSLRRYADFMWQRGPFELGEGVAVEGQKQSPGTDLSEPYWMSRYYRFLTEGEGQVLAWQDLGACP